LAPRALQERQGQPALLALTAAQAQLAQRGRLGLRVPSGLVHLGRPEVLAFQDPSGPLGRQARLDLLGRLGHRGKLDLQETRDRRVLPDPLGVQVLKDRLVL